MSRARPRQAASTASPASPGDLAGLGKLEAEALAVFCFADQRPLSGVAGFVDWRVCGALSRALESGAFHGRLEETMLMPTCGRLGKRRLFVFGLGPLEACSGEVLRGACRQAYRTMRQAGVGQPVFAAPSARGNARRIETEFVGAVADELGGKVARILVERAS